MTKPTDQSLDEPLLIAAMRRADESDHVRIRTTGTTIGGFLREYDEWVAAHDATVRAETLRGIGAEYICRHGKTVSDGHGCDDLRDHAAGVR